MRQSSTKKISVKFYLCVYIKLNINILMYVLLSYCNSISYSIDRINMEIVFLRWFSSFLSLRFVITNQALNTYTYIHIHLDRYIYICKFFSIGTNVCLQTLLSIWCVSLKRPHRILITLSIPSLTLEKYPTF